MADYAFFIKAVTGIINNRIGKDREMVTSDEVEKVFAFKKMNQDTLLSLSKILVNETRKFPAFELNLIDGDDSIQEMVDLGLISFEWREDREQIKEEDEGKENVPSSEEKGDSAVKNNSKNFTECSELFVIFDIDEISMYKEFVELKIMPLVAHYVIKGLDLNCSLESMPVKPRRRKDSNEVWCQLIAKYENNNITKKVLNFAEKSPLARSRCADIPRKIKVYFSLDDTVDIDNPWGSCPLLHNGTNFRTPEFSRYFNECTDSKVDTAENTCFIYSQKNPTIEIPSKLNTEAEIVMRGIVRDAKHLFREEKEEKGTDNKKLMIAMALSHPKSRIRNIGNFYFSAHLPKCISKFEKTWKCPTTHCISMGRDANIVSLPNDEKGRENENQEPTIGQNSISRKLSVSSYRCLACRGLSNKCSERDRFYRPSKFSSSNHLSHGNGIKIIDILLNSKNNVSKKLAYAIDPNSASSKFTTKSCDHGAVCHNFFCRGVQPVCTPFSSVDSKKNKLVLYGKLVDVVNTNFSANVLNNHRRRIFYTNEELKKNGLPIRLENAKTAFKDIVYHECNDSHIKIYAKKNKVSASSTSSDKKWWKTMVDLTADFDRHVERFYTDLANLQDKSKLFIKNCETIFSEFSEKCKTYSQAKSKLLNTQKEEEEEKEKKNEINEIVDVLEEYHARDDAATSTLMQKSMFLGSRTVFSGVRCVVSEENREFDIRQYVVTMAGSAVTKVTDEDLHNYTPVKGAVSVTTAPNDKLPLDAHQTWQNCDASKVKSITRCTSLPIECNNWRAVENRPLKQHFFSAHPNKSSVRAHQTRRDSDTDNIKSYFGRNRYTSLIIKCDNWRIVERLSSNGSFNQRSFYTSSNKLPVGARQDCVLIKCDNWRAVKRPSYQRSFSRASNKLSSGATWQDNSNLNSPTECSRCTVLPIKCENWRAVERPSYASFNQCSSSKTKYIPPPLRKKCGRDHHRQ